MRKKIAALTIAAATTMSALAAPTVFAEEANTSSVSGSSLESDSLSSSGGLFLVGAIIAVFAAEGFSSALNAPYCGANPEQCPNSLTAHLSSTMSSEIDKARHAVPRLAPIPR